jgi:hypothetical protein
LRVVAVGGVAVSHFVQQALWLPLMLVLGSIFGPWMFFTYPDFSVQEKTCYGLSLLLSALLMGVGWWWRKKLIGKLLIVFGILSWGVLGCFGLGTGT